MSEQPLSMVETVGANVRRLRDARGLSAQKLASATGGRLSRPAIARLEAGERDAVTVEEVATLASALGVSPLSLLAPHDDDAKVALPDGRVVRGFELRQWWAGSWPLPGADPDELFVYLSNEPITALEAHIFAGNDTVVRFVIENLERLPISEEAFGELVEYAMDRFHIDRSVGEDAGPFEGWLYDRWIRAHGKAENDAR